MYKHTKLVQNGNKEMTSARVRVSGSKYTATSPAIAENEPIVCTALSVQRADDGYSRRDNFGRSLLRSK